LGFGNAGKDAVVGPGRVNFTTSLYKSFAVTERAHFELRFESFNTFNHAEGERHQRPQPAERNRRPWRQGDTFGQITSAWDPAYSNWAASSCSKPTLNRGAAGNPCRAPFLFCVLESSNKI
jgi:hypothetical protein